MVAIKEKSTDFPPSAHICSAKCRGKKKRLHFIVRSRNSVRAIGDKAFLNCICNKPIDWFKCDKCDHWNVWASRNKCAYLSLHTLFSQTFELEFWPFQFCCLHSKHVQLESIKFERFHRRWHCIERSDQIQRTDALDKITLVTNQNMNERWAKQYSGYRLGRNKWQWRKWWWK